MSNKYKEWKNRKITYLCENTGDWVGHITAEDLYQEFKARLIEELLVDTDVNPGESFPLIDTE